MGIDDDEAGAIAAAIEFAGRADPGMIAGILGRRHRGADKAAAGNGGHRGTRCDREAGGRSGGGIGWQADFAGADEVADLFLEHHERSRSEEHTSELQSLMRISYAVLCLKKK